MLDCRWERDTLFLVFEEDFRFRPQEAPGRRPMSELRGVAELDEATGAQSASSSDARVRERLGVPPEGRPCEPTARGPAKQFEGSSAVHPLGPQVSPPPLPATVHPTMTM